MAILNQNANNATIQENATTVANEKTANAATAAATAKPSTQDKGKKGKDENTKKRKAISPMWRVLTKARKTFKPQISKSSAIKQQCIGIHLSDSYPDIEKFWAEYQEQCEILLDSRKFHKDCKSLRLIPENVAEHIVFSGSAIINKVLKKGVETLGLDLQLYRDRVSPQIKVGEEIEDAFRTESKVNEKVNESEVK